MALNLKDEENNHVVLMVLSKLAALQSDHLITGSVPNCIVDARRNQRGEFFMYLYAAFKTCTVVDLCVSKKCTSP